MSNEQEPRIASEERSSWVMVIVTIVAYAIYLSLVLSGGASLPLAPSDYGWQVLWTIGGVASLMLAILEVDHFWIANTVYLTFVLSAVLGAVAKIAFYRGGLPTW